MVTLKQLEKLYKYEMKEHKKRGKMTRHKKKHHKHSGLKVKMSKHKIVYLRPFGKSKEVVTDIGKRML